MSRGRRGGGCRRGGGDVSRCGRGGGDVNGAGAFDVDVLELVVFAVVGDVEVGEEVGSLRGYAVRRTASGGGELSDVGGADGDHDAGCWGERCDGGKDAWGKGIYQCIEIKFGGPHLHVAFSK